MRVKVIDKRTGKEKIMSRQFATILEKLGRVVPVQEAVVAPEPPAKKSSAKRTYKRRDMKAEG